MHAPPSTPFPSTLAELKLKAAHFAYAI